MSTTTQKQITQQLYTEVSIPGSDEPVFVLTDKALSDPAMRLQMLANARRDLTNFEIEYGGLDELADLLEESAERVRAANNA